MSSAPTPSRRARKFLDGRLDLAVALGDGGALLHEAEDSDVLVGLDIHQHARLDEHRGRGRRGSVRALGGLVLPGRQTALAGLRVADVAQNLRETDGGRSGDEQQGQTQ
jgi:hypothetical protein